MNLNRIHKAINGCFGLVDNLSMTYEGNMLTSVCDSASRLPYADSTDYLLGGSLTLRNGRVDKLQFEEGYCQAVAFPGNPIQDNIAFYYYDRDHLGNIRQVIKALGNSGNVAQAMTYYPFGAQFCNGSPDSDAQSRRYNGKELDKMHGLNTYDYGARQYNPVTARWDRVDPMAEKKPWQSAYVYGRNNPLRFIDPDGNDDFDKVMGYIIGITTDIIPFTGSARDLYTPTDACDYNAALRTTDNAFMAIGEGMSNVGKGGAAIGAATMATGGVIVVGSGGAATMAGAPAFALGASIAGAGAATGLTGNLLKMSAASNREGGYDRGKRTGASNNERHGDGGRALTKIKMQLSDLQNQLSSATSKKEMKRIKKKMENIRKDAENKYNGEEHSRSNKRKK